jgi:hypothetical protein
MPMNACPSPTQKRQTPAQAFTHIGVINAALALARARRGGG